MCPNVGGGVTKGLTPSWDSALTTTEDSGSDDSSPEQSIRYPEGQSHGVTVYVQLDDNNSLYETLTDAQRDLNNERGENADSDNPHYLGEHNAEWTDGIDELGFFSTRVPYGEDRGGSWTQYYAQVLNLYESVEDSQIANNPAKRRLEVHKRTNGLTYEDGNEFTWPDGWQTGESYEGTLLKIQCSYINSPAEAIAHAFDLIEATDILSEHELRETKDPIAETIRFSGLESHHRVHRNHEKDAINTLRDSARLVSTEGDGKENAVIEKGHHQIYSFRNNRFDFLGFDKTLQWYYRGEEYRDYIEQHYMKVYRHSSANKYPESDPRAHPKIEVKADGSYPGPAWEAVKHQLDTILNAHTYDFAGIRKTGLIEDDYHDGPEQPETVTNSPAEYRISLQDYFKSNGFKKEIISLLVNNRSNAAKDILYTIIRYERPIAYDELKSETGLTKGTIRKWVSRLEDLGAVERQMDACMFVRMSDFAREHLRDVIDITKPAGDTKREIERRKEERIAKREDTETDTETSQPVATDGGTDMDNNPPKPSETTRDTTDEHRDTPIDRPPD